MVKNTSYFRSIKDRHSIITPIQGNVTYPEFIEEKLKKYEPYIKDFANYIDKSLSSAELLERIRDSSVRMDSEKRMALLKLFRRCVSPVCDTEATKKIVKNPTSLFVDNYGHTFKPIKKLKKQFKDLNGGRTETLSALLGEYDSRGNQGYVLTDLFFTWFEETFEDLKISGPRGAGNDIQLSSILTDFPYEYPCDFIIQDKKDHLIAVGFARYDSTRGGAQSDDRTGGNMDKVSKAQRYSLKTGKQFKIIFLAEGPGLAHKDTWEESCKLDGQWNGNVRVSTLKLAPKRITQKWLSS
jgi:hypothetical protein